MCRCSHVIAPLDAAFLTPTAVETAGSQNFIFVNSNHTFAVPLEDSVTWSRDLINQFTQGYATLSEICAGSLNGNGARSPQLAKGHQ